MPDITIAMIVIHPKSANLAVLAAIEKRYFGAFEAFLNF